MSGPAGSPSLVDNPYCSDWFDLSRSGRVLLRTGKVEIGQGVLTALVQIAADELDIAPERFDVLSGHTRLGPLEGQTSSSLSMEVTGRAVRLAASALRQRLALEAAKLQQARPEEIAFVDGAVRVSGRDTPLTSWSLAQEIDLQVSVIEHASPKPAALRRVVGASLPRRDLREKAASAAFIQDITLPGMLHGRVLQPPSPRSRIRQFDGRALQARFSSCHIVRNGSFVGVMAQREEVAMAAIAAAARLTRWDEGAPAPADLLTAIADSDAPEEVTLEQGLMDQAHGQEVSITVRRAYMAHASVAPSCAIARWEDRDLEVYSHTQGPHGLRDALGIVFDLAPLDHITVIHAPGAGTFGHSGQDDVALDAALLAKEVPGTPVRVLWSRADDFIGSPLGPGMVVSARAWVDGERLSAFSVVSRSQPHAQRPGRGGIAGMTAAELIDPPLPWTPADDVPLSRGGGAERNAVPLYTIPNLRVAKRIIKDLPVRTSALRGLGAYANVFAVEALIDEAALVADIDPVQFRLAHLDDARAQAVIATAAEMAGWPGSTHDDEALGLGFARYKNKSAYCAVVVRVRLERELQVTHAWACADAGEVINPDGLSNQVEGGILQATSWTLKESIAFDGDRVVTDSWSAYPILRFAEVPEVQVELLGHPQLPSLGAGETSIGPTAAAIGNAVRRALGVRVAELPITREAILRAAG